MARFWLLSALLVLWVAPARAISEHDHDLFEDAAEGQAETDPDDKIDAQSYGGVVAQSSACVGDSCPTTMVDSILYGYGTACSGLDWRFLHAVGIAESGLDPKNHTGKYVGLFQMDQDACGDNLGEYKSFLSCKDLEDPEVNTAVAADRFDRYFRGRGDYPSILKTCPDNSPAENMALAYIGHNNGPAVLKLVLRRKACKDKAIRKAVASFYENNPHSRDDGKFLNGAGQLVNCKASYGAKYGIVGTKSYRCVNAKWGIAKYDYGRRRVASVAGIERLYVPGITGKTSACQALVGKRMFSKETIVASISDGSFRDKPLDGMTPADPAMIARLAERGSDAAERGQVAYVDAYKTALSWPNQSANLTMYVPIAGTEEKAKGGYKPRARVPARFKREPSAPPSPMTKASDERPALRYFKSLIEF